MKFEIFLNYKKLYVTQLRKWNELARDYIRLAVKYHELKVAYSILQTESKERRNSLVDSMETIFVPFDKIKADPTTAIRYGITYTKQGSRMATRLVLVTMHQSLFERIKGNLTEADICTLKSKDYPPRRPTEREMDSALKDLK